MASSSDDMVQKIFADAKEQAMKVNGHKPDGGGGGGSAKGWRRNPEEDDRQWARRCLAMAGRMMKPVRRVLRR